MTQDELLHIGQRLADPTTTADDRSACYAVLRMFSDSLKLRDEARRHELVHFSNGLELPTHKVAQLIHRHSLADFCIAYGLTRTEVLERTGMARAGVA